MHLGLAERILPPAHRLAIDSAGPTSVGVVHLTLVTEYPREAIFIRLLGRSAKHHTGIPGNLPLEFGGKDKVREILVGAEKAIRLPWNTSPHDGAVLGFELHLTALDRPSTEVLLVEEIGKSICLQIRFGIFIFEKR